MISQFIQGRITGITSKGVLNLVLFKFFRILRRVFLLAGDPLVKSRIWGFEYQLPLSHDLPTNLKNHPGYSYNVSRIAKRVKEKYPSLALIDVGANIGDTVAVLRKESLFPILCIEGDPFFFSLLEKNTAQFKDVTLVRTYAGETDGPLPGSIHKEKGTSRISGSGEGGNAIGIRTLTGILAGRPDFARSKMLKTDTDGFDNRIIRGAKDFLAKTHPVIFFEYDPWCLEQAGDDGVSIFGFLDGLGYKHMIVYDNIGNYHAAMRPGDGETVRALHRAFSGFRSTRYCDICAFHAEDGDLFERINERESQ